MWLRVAATAASAPNEGTCANIDEVAVHAPGRMLNLLRTVVTAVYAPEGDCCIRVGAVAAGAPAREPQRLLRVLMSPAAKDVGVGCRPGNGGPCMSGSL